MALLVALGTGVSVGVPLALRSGSSLQERLGTANTILAQVPLIDGLVFSCFPLLIVIHFHNCVWCHLMLLLLLLLLLFLLITFTEPKNYT